MTARSDALRFAFVRDFAPAGKDTYFKVRLEELLTEYTLNQEMIKNV